MLRVALLAAALVAAPVSGWLAVQDDPVDAQPATGAAASEQASRTEETSTSTVVLTGDELPDSAGWFAAPIEADTPASVHVRFTPRLDNTDDQPKVAVPFYVQHDRLYTYLMAAGHEKPTSVHAADQRVECCTDRFHGQGGRANLSLSTGTAPETPLYVGLLAHGWRDGDSVTIRATSDQAAIEAGSIRTGTDVEAVDLFEEARRDPSVRGAGLAVPGDRTDVDLEWRAGGSGLVSVAWEYEEGRGDVELGLPNGSTLASGPSLETDGSIDVVAGSGEYSLSFTNASRDSPDEGEAFALFADVELPYERQRVTVR